MKIEVIRLIPLEELVAKIREIPLMKPGADGKPIYVYAEADITLRDTSAQEVNPPTFYLLRNNLETQRALHRLLLDQEGIDTLRLNGAVELKNEKGEIWTLTPPIIEHTLRRVQYHPTDQGESVHTIQTEITIPLICDGAHRISVARETNSKFNAIHIVGATPSHKYYAHPNSWADVKEVEVVPRTMDEKKMYRFADSYALYRDFGAIGCGKPRLVGK